MSSSPRPPKSRPPLIVSANPDIVDLYVLSMRSLRTPVLSASGVEDARQLLRDGAVSALVVDVANPATDWMLCRTLRAEADAAIPLIVLTGWLDPEARAEALAVGCAAFVSKPVSPERLMEIVRRACEGERDIFHMD